MSTTSVYPPIPAPVVPVGESVREFEARHMRALRAYLKEVFPSTRFSVRKSSTVGGLWARVSWVDSVTEFQVSEAVAGFVGYRMDGQDCVGQVPGARWLFSGIFTDRQVSESHVGAVARWVGCVPGEGVATVLFTERGQAWASVGCRSKHVEYGSGDSVEAVAYRLARFVPAPIPEGMFKPVSVLSGGVSLVDALGA